MSQAATGNLFNISASGNPANLNITLCLNGNGPLSCQNYNVAAVNLSISTAIPNHVYPNIGIKINTSGYTPTGCSLISNGYCLFSASHTSPSTVIVKIGYPLVVVGNPGNSADSLTGFGAVNYEYDIGKYDVTIAQYTNFLNAIAKTDTHELYNPSMGTDLNTAGIAQSGEQGSFVYTVMDNDGNSANRPITYVDWYAAARFANWMANGQPTGCQGPETTENGAYDLAPVDELLAKNIGYKTLGKYGCVIYLKNLRSVKIKTLDLLTAPAKNSINPNTQAALTFYIPQENEWYKAAYYDPELNQGEGGYYLYPTQSNTAPGNAVGASSNQANYFTTVFSLTQSANYLSMGENYLTDVGAFSNSPSYYGTYDQGGDVWQWNDLDGGDEAYRGLRGGYWFSGSVPMQSILYSTDSLTRADSGLGFRLAAPMA